MQRHDPVYMDYAATTPLDPTVLAEMLPYLEQDFGNAASQHAFGQRSFHAVSRAREEISTLIGASPQEIIFTSGSTESINLALKGCMAAAPADRRHFVTAATEHKAVLDTATALEESGVHVTVLPVDRDGRIRLDDFRQVIAERPWLVSLMAANNETGCLGPIAEAAMLAADADVFFHTDATQLVGKLPMNVKEPAIDLMSFSAHKFYGPKGVGALYAARAVQQLISPQIHGGGHERALRSGTLNVPGIVGFGAAARIASEKVHTEAEAVRLLRDALEQCLLAAVPAATVNGSTAHRLPNITNIHLPGVDADSLVLAMDDVAVSSGSACTSASPSPSHVLLAMGVSYEAAGESVRFSIGRFTTEDDIRVCRDPSRGGRASTATPRCRGNRAMMSTKPTFARHESFYPRVGWLWKAVTISDQMPDVFLRDDATVELGVGKNMVRAIRYWGLATKVIQEFPDPTHPRRSLARPTALGRLLFGSGGWDPFLEDPRTLWLLHWMLLRNPSIATTWDLIFGMWSRGDFSESEACAWTKDRASREPDWPPVSDASIRRDVQCLTQMYGPTRRKTRGDEVVESPFRDLSLLVLGTAESGRWRFAYGNKPGLTDGIVAFAALDFVSRDVRHSTHTISRLALDPNSPGLVFRINDARIANALAAVSVSDARLEVISPAGVRQLATRTTPTELAVAVLAREFGFTSPGGTVDQLVSGDAHEAAA